MAAAAPAPTVGRGTPKANLGGAGSGHGGPRLRATVNDPFTRKWHAGHMTVEAPTRELKLEVAYNVRHLGGYPARAGRATRADVVRSASLHRLTAAGVERLAATGVRVVVDLRSRAEREEYPTPGVSALGIETINAPVFEADASPTGLAGQFPGFQAVYRSMLESGRGAYRTLFEVIADTPGGVLFHCAAGKDRTGVAAALLLDLAGVADETILDDYSRSAALLAPLLPEWLPRIAERGLTEAQARALMASHAGDMQATLAHIRERWGSAEGYMEDIGVSFDAISAVRARLVA